MPKAKSKKIVLHLTVNEAQALWRAAAAGCEIDAKSAQIVSVLAKIGAALISLPVSATCPPRRTE